MQCDLSLWARHHGKNGALRENCETCVGLHDEFMRQSLERGVQAFREDNLHRIYSELVGHGSQMTGPRRALRLHQEHQGHHCSGDELGLTMAERPDFRRPRLSRSRSIGCSTR